MSTIRKTLYALLITVVALVALEFGLRALEPDVAAVSASPGGWQAKFFAQFLGWHEPDADLLWRHRSNLHNPLLTTNSVGLLGPEISPYKSKRARRILLLGDSTPVGIGLKRRADAFGERLTALLNELNPDFEWELINAAVSGYSSAQVARAAPRLISKYQPDVIVVHVGANDASLSGAQSDRAALAARGSSLARVALEKSALARTLARLLGKSQFSDPAGPLQLRATSAEFAENISLTIALAEQSHRPLVLIKPAAPRLWPAGLQFKVFRHFSDSLGEPLMPPRLRELLGADLLYCFSAEMRAALYPELDEFTERALAAQFADSLSVEGTLVMYRNAVEADSADFVALNNVGVTLWKAGVYDSALV
ncbi:MAG TPA: SGNH/GDSL hydrolase family protein, partial [candidate division Zixibacteria bacterium]|nr:SGNH/GDSL hydrolase family protein [candidate division Zixibacteria bacterium]